jgi:hypothetical protein
VSSSEAIKISLKSLTKIVKAVNKEVLNKSDVEKIGFDSSLTLAKRTNSLFTKLLDSWLVSDVTINYFCFDLRGFTFVLDTIGTDDGRASAQASGAEEESKEDGALASVKQKIKQSAMAGSDLEMLVMGKLGAEEHPVWDACHFLKPADDKKAESPGASGQHQAKTSD